MKLDDNYEIVLEVANEEDGVYGDEVYGDIYDDYSECKKEHPNDRITFGYEIINKKTGLNAIEENIGIDEWYDFVEDAIWAWEKYLKEPNDTYSREPNEVNIWYRKGASQKITKDEFMTLLDYCCPGGIIDRDKYHFSDETIDEIMSNFDTDGDGYIPSSSMEVLAEQNGIKLKKGCFDISCR